ncbi:MAG: (2Fe-2S)-binding protein [Wenzhouxiangellaceae bacterium]
MMARTLIELQVNGETRELLVRPEETLLETLRDQLLLTGSKRGCNQGVCGACTVLIDGAPVRACLSLSANCTEAQITTIEGLATSGELLPIQKAFIGEGAPQCGFCMSGMVLAAKALLDETPNPNVDQVREGLSGNLCRCTGYVRVIDAVLAAAAGRYG